MADLIKYNELFYGKSHKRNKRDGGLYSLVKERVKKLTFDHKLAFALLESCARLGDDINERKFEQDFLARHGEEVCNFLKLDYTTVKHSIETLWGEHDD